MTFLLLFAAVTVAFVVRDLVDLFIVHPIRTAITMRAMQAYQEKVAHAGARSALKGAERVHRFPRRDDATGELIEGSGDFGGEG